LVRTQFSLPYYAAISNSDAVTGIRLFIVFAPAAQGPRFVQAWKRGTESSRREWRSEAQDNPKSPRAEGKWRTFCTRLRRNGYGGRGGYGAASPL